MRQTKKRKIPDADMKKKNLRQIGFSAILILAFLSVLVAACIPGGAEKTWHSVFSFFGLNDFSSCADSAALSVHILDVGKADSILIENQGKYMLVDGGTADRGDDVAAYLKRRRVKTLDFVVNTHPDDDHIGGLKQVLLSFTVKKYFAPYIPQKIIPSSIEYKDVQSVLKLKKLSTEHPIAGSSYLLGKVKIEVLGPVVTGNSTNNNSIVLRLTFGKNHFLLMGDAENEEEQTLLASGRDLSADVLKVGHHGSDTSTTQDFVQAVKPKYAAISVGNDTNKLPKQVVLKRLSDAGISILRTDISGTIIFMSDGKSISVKTEK